MHWCNSCSLNIRHSSKNPYSQVWERESYCKNCGINSKQETLHIQRRVYSKGVKMCRKQGKKWRRQLKKRQTLRLYKQTGYCSYWQWDWSMKSYLSRARRYQANRECIELKNQQKSLLQLDISKEYILISSLPEISKFKLQPYPTIQSIQCLVDKTG